jgi:hypothetical protein
MPRTSPNTILLSDSERTQLEATARRYTAPYFEVIRAKLILLAADGLENEVIAQRLDLPGRSSASGENGSTPSVLRDPWINLAADGPLVFPPHVVVQVKAMACELTARQNVPLSRFSAEELAREAVLRGLVASISDTTVWRWLSIDALKPWQHRSWIFHHDPDFEAKAGPVLDLYQGFYEGKPLRPDEYVISADEKTSIQARIRIHPTQAPAPGSAMRVEHEYERGGALAYLAAWDVRRAKVFGRCESATGIEPFGRLVEQVMVQEPYASARRVFWILGNGSSHRGKACVERLQAAWPTLKVVHLPVHASWLNQIEIYFSIVQRKVVTPNDFPSLAAVEERLIGFQSRFEQSARPIRVEVQPRRPGTPHGAAWERDPRTLGALRLRIRHRSCVPDH